MRHGERRSINLNSDVNGERLEEEDERIRVGDLVWGKVKGYPWWPGQVFDSSDASEFAMRYSQEGRLLVAFFGDGSCSWCLPSQLVPFVENFDRMWGEKPSGSFVKAVQGAVDEIARLVESRMVCRCISSGRLARPVVAYAGVKPGVLAPEVDVGRLPVPVYGPAQIRAKVLGFAKSASFESVFELVVVRSWMSAYSYKECSCGLAEFTEPLFIEGLEDRDVKKKISVITEGPNVDEGIASPVQSRAPTDDNVFRRSKQKSVAELMAKKTPKRKEGEIGNGKMGSSPRDRKKSKYLSPPFIPLKGRLGELTLVDLMGKDTAGGDSRDRDFSVFAFLEELDEDEQKATFLASDVDLEVNELLKKMQLAAVDRFYLRDKGSLDPVWAFISAYRNATYAPESSYNSHHKCKKVGQKRKKPSLATPRPRGCSPKISLPCKRPAYEPVDDLVSDARVIRQKLDSMTKILEDCGSRFSSDDKSCLKEEMKRLMEDVGTAGEKVRLMAEKSSS